MMSGLLLAAALVQAGTTFTCKLDTAYLTIVAPSEEVTVAYRGNILTLYKVTGDGEIFPTPPRIRQVFDSLPDDLVINLVTDGDVSIELAVSNIDAEINAAAINLTATRKDETLATLSGLCEAAANTGPSKP